ncbi:MAG: SOS response-associated peptidase family protein [Rhodanobacter sp.]
MCYSAQIVVEHRKFEREYGATIDIRRYVELFWEKRNDGGWLKIPKAMRGDWGMPRNDAERELADLVVAADAAQANALQSELFAQRTRLVAAERSLASRTTKKATNDQRVARDKIERAQRNLADLSRTHALDRDARLFPGQYAPVLIERDGVRTIVPMRYQCRLPGWSAQTERKYPGTYNARRDKLGNAWSRLFGKQHGILVINAFYENIGRAAMEHRQLAPDEGDENVVLEFRPVPPQDMLVACLWSYSAEPGQGVMYSFAAITDEPPPEIAAAGHDRCVVPIKRENLDAWLRPEAADVARQQVILDDRERPFYEHRQAA